MFLNKCFIIAELSANHGGDINIAKETVRAAKRAGADAIKLQTYTADTITLDVKNDYFKISQDTAWDGQYLHDLYKEASLPWEWHEELYQVAEEEGLICFSSPFDKTAVDFLEELKTPIYKVASFEITDIPLIKYIASKKKPIIISTGIATLEDIELAIDTCKSEGNSDITILKCTSAYPASPEDANLLTIPDIIKRFGVNSGLSDHTMGIEAPVVAVCLGAKVIEKHFILDKKIGGADAHFSLDEKEFKKMVEAVRLAEVMLGKVDYEMTAKKQKSREFSRSLFISKDVKKGDLVTEKNVRSVRPGFGLHPKYYNEILGKKFTGDFDKGTPLIKEMFL
ncbi:pseudaminic acid synthase [Aquimarina sp. W85]|uniref:pseudaminic acid synthase n=1 Tax=Aquimarina rhodophyticola TaxID=3342246 RepID=UPI0036729018